MLKTLCSRLGLDVRFLAKHETELRMAGFAGKLCCDLYLSFNRN